MFQRNKWTPYTWTEDETQPAVQVQVKSGKEDKEVSLKNFREIIKEH